VNVRGPTNDRPRYRAWALVALLTLGALAINPPLTFKVRPSSRSAARSVPLAARPRPQIAGSPIPAVLRSAIAPPGRSDIPNAGAIDPPPASVVPASLSTILSDSDAVDPIPTHVLDESKRISTSLSEAVLAPARLDSDVVRSAFIPEPTAAEADSSPEPDLAIQGPTLPPAAADVLADQAVDFAGRVSSLAQVAGQLFTVPGFDDVERLPAPALAVDPLFAAPAFGENESVPKPAPSASHDISATASETPQQQPNQVPILAQEPTTSAGEPAQPALMAAPAAIPTPADALTAALPPLPGTTQSNVPVSALPASPAQASSNKSEEAKSQGDDQVQQTGCATCGGFHKNADGPALHDSMSCGDGGCIPGRAACNGPSHESDTVVGAFLNNLYQCLCCPDPCYEPRWEPAANASFFADYARPRTVTRVRYDNLENMVRPDRNLFWMGAVTPTRTTNKRAITDLRARLQEVYVYQEAASARGSFFIEYGYRQLNSSFMPTQAGFSDLNFGIKSLFFDCELLQLSFQFRTFTPTGNSTLGLGTGHFSLDPSILASLKLGPDTYLQGQFGNWIPIGATSQVAGGMFYAFTSLNQVLWYPRPDSPLIGTLEMDIWSFENGGYTAAIGPSGKAVTVEKGGGVSYFNIGPGLRQSICNRLDFGGAITFAPGVAHWAEPWFRFEVRFLF
jgi:hypothetical protein